MTICVIYWREGVEIAIFLSPVHLLAASSLDKSFIHVCPSVIYSLTETETEIWMIWKLTAETETEKTFKTEIQ